MNSANQKGHRYHEMADMMEHNPILRILLEKSDLSSEYVECQARDTIEYKLYN